MKDKLKLMCILAHPDDETLGTGGTLARYAAEGVETHVVTATRGERGWPGRADEYPGQAELGRLREAELRAAARELGVESVRFLDYVDGDLDQADTREALRRIVVELRRVRPRVVVTFAPDGGYGHTDHIAISQLATTAVACAADAAFEVAGDEPTHLVSKLYYMAWPASQVELYVGLFGEIVMSFDGVERRVAPWPDWAVTTWIDAEEHWQTVWRAVGCHRSQIPDLGVFSRLSESQHRVVWGRQCYYRAMSTVNGGRRRETDLFEGLRNTVSGADQAAPEGDVQ